MGFKVNDSIDIEASADEIFGVVNDFDSYPEWNPEVKGVEVKERDDEGRPTLVWWRIDARIKTVGYTLEYDYSAMPESYSWTLVDGDIKGMNGSYAFDEFEEVTEVRYEADVDPGFPVPGLLRRQGERRLKEAALDELKKRVEGG